MEYEQISLYVEDRDEFYDFIRQLETEYEVAKEAEKREIHTAILRVAQAHEHEVLNKLGGETRDKE